MKVVKVMSFGSPEELVLAEVGQGEVGLGQVVIAVEAAGVGHVDLLMRKGFFPGFSSPGFVPGIEVAGTVIKIGDKVNKGWMGQRVFAITPSGGYAEEVVVDHSALARIPEGVSATAAVALGVNALVAEYSLEKAGCTFGQNLLVRGAGGGIGVLSTQLAVLKGASVTAITSSRYKQQKLEALSVKKIIIGQEEGNDSHDRYDIIIDPVAGSGVQYFINKLNPNGRYILNGAAAGIPKDTFASTLVSHFQKSLTVSCMSLTSIETPSLTSTIEGLFDLAEKGRLLPIIAETYSLSEVAEAHRRLETGQAFGKIVIVIE